MDILPTLPFSPVTILIVDDEPHVRKFLRLSLQAENFSVVEAASAEEAITLVHHALPDIWCSISACPISTGGR